jgi:HEAT repeat protein
MVSAPSKGFARLAALPYVAQRLECGVFRRFHGGIGIPPPGIFDPTPLAISAFPPKSLALILPPKPQMNAPGPEPRYQGKPLSEWALTVLEHGVNARPTDSALEAMEAVRAIGVAAIPHLLAWLQPPFRNPLLPAGATRCFKALGSAAASAIPQLARMLNDSKPLRSSGAYGGWHDVIEALSYLGPEALPILLSAATNGANPEFQADVIHNLGNFGPDGGPANPALIAWSRHEDLWIRFWAVYALGRIAQQPAAVIPVLLSALKDSEAIVRREAAQALGRFGKAAGHTFSELIRAADDADWHAQPGAIAALVRIGEQPDVVLPLLVRKLHDGNWILRRCAAVALGDFGGQKAFDALMEAADDPQGFVREVVFQSLKMIDPAALEKSGRKFKTSGPPRG